MNIIDIKLELTSDSTVTVRKVDAGITHYTIRANNVVPIRDSLERAAVSCGYERYRADASDASDASDAPEISHLMRRAQKIHVIAHPQILEVTVDDPEALPFSRTDGVTVAVDDLNIPIKSTRIVPGKERHLDGGSTWTGQWCVYDREAADLIREIRTELERQYAINGLFGPTSGIGQWQLEVSRKGRLVKVFIAHKDDHLELTIKVVNGVLV